MTGKKQDNIEYISLNAGRTSRWVWWCFLAILCVMLSVLWEIRFPLVIKTDMVLNSDLYQAKNVFNIRMSLPEKEAGYIKPGQLVQLRLDDYPFGKFGYVLAKLKKIGSLHNRELTVEVDLPDGLMTTRKKMITANGISGLKGNAVIVTENTRLLRRLYNAMKIFN